MLFTRLSGDRPAAHLTLRLRLTSMIIALYYRTSVYA